MDVAAWLQALGLERYLEAFQANDVDADVLRSLSDADLKELGVASLGHRKKLLEAIAALGPPARAAAAARGGATARDAERRQLTVLFCDLVGSTELSAELDPEAMREVITAYQEAVAREVERGGGHVAKFMGDGVLAYFGFPRAHEHDAERAVRAGLALVAAVAGLSTAGRPLAARVGIATGLVVVGDLVGHGAAQEEAVIGETPNLAARLQTLAKPGSVVISQATRRLVGGLFELTDLGPQRLKGFAEPLAAFRIEGAGRAASRFEALRGERLTPLVGREHELALLLERWTWAKEGDGQVVLIGGEPGIGKSRLLQALREQLSQEPHVALSHFCSPYHTHSALHPIIAQLERAAGFAPGDTAGDKRGKLATLLGRATTRLDDALPLLAALLGLPADERHPAPNLGLQRQKRRTLEVLLEQLAGLARARPVLEVYEDLHWADPSTFELLDLLVERVRQLPVLAVLTYRPEFEPPWRGQEHVTTLTMNRLGRRQGAAMVARVTGGKALPDEILEQIVARTEGVPLFVEELTKTVLESGLLRDAGDHWELSGPLPPLAIPATLHDSLMARLDRLASVKDVAQTAAVIGREFSHAVLAAISRLPAGELEAALDQLVAAELVYRRGAPPRATYSFKHVLVQDAAYQSLLKARRRQLHGRIASVLVEDFPETVSSQPEIVAYHFDQAGMAAEAVEYWHRAGENAARRSANLEAIRHLQAALDRLAALPEDRGRAERQMGLLTLLGPAQIVTRSRTAEEVATTLERARGLAQELGSLDHLIPATLGLWYLHMNRGALDRADEVGRELFDLASKRGDDGFVLQAHHAAWTTPLFTGDFRTVRHHVERGLALYDRARHGSHAFLYLGHDPCACAHALGALALWMLSLPDQAVRLSAAGIAFAEQLEHAPTLVHVLALAGTLHVVRRDHAAAAAVGERLFAIASELDMAPAIATADSLAGWAMTQAGEREAGLARLERGVTAWQTSGARLHLPQRLSMLADGLSLAGRVGTALEANAQARRLAEDTGERWYDGMILWQRGELLQLRADGRDRAEAAYRASLELARRREARSLALRAATSLGRLWAEQGRRGEACELLAPIYHGFTEGFETADLEEAKALLAQLA